MGQLVSIKNMGNSSRNSDVIKLLPLLKGIELERQIQNSKWIKCNRFWNMLR